MADTPRTTLERPAPGDTLAVSSFDRIRARRHPVRPTGRGRGFAARAGAAGVRDPRADLQMFDLAPAEPAAGRPLRATLSNVVEELSPLLPPVVSEPARTRGRAWASRPGLVPSTESRAPRTPSPRAQRTRLTMRGWAALFALAITGISAASAVTVATGDPAAAVPAVEVVVRSGESVEQIAERIAGGRGVADVSVAIRDANGLPVGVLPQAGEVLLVPGR